MSSLADSPSPGERQSPVMAYEVIYAERSHDTRWIVQVRATAPGRDPDRYQFTAYVPHTESDMTQGNYPDRALRTIEAAVRDAVASETPFAALHLTTLGGDTCIA